MESVTERLRKVNSEISLVESSSRKGGQYEDCGRKYYKKIIDYGDVIEIWIYEDPVFINYDKGGRKMQNYVSDEYVEHRRDSVVRAWRKIVNFGNSNFDNKDKFVTLTFSPFQYDLEVANREFKKFVQRLRYEYDDFKYLTIIELHHSGGIHYHMLSTLPFIENRAPNRKLEKIWGNGTVTINRITSVDNIGVYLTGYANKVKKKKHPKLQKGKTYLRSNNLVLSPALINEEYERKLQQLKNSGRIEADKEGNIKNVRVNATYKRPIKKMVESLDKREFSRVEYIQINARNTYKKAAKIFVDVPLESL